MRVFGYVCAWMILALAGAWTVVDSLAADLTRTAVRELSADALLQFEDAGLRPPNTAYFKGIVLDDPVTGQTVARFASVEADWGIERDEISGEWGVIVRQVRGSLGQVVLTTGNIRTGLVRAIEVILSTLSGSLTADDEPSRPPPPMIFRHVDVLLQAEELALQSLPDCTVWITSRDDRLHVDVDVGAAGGRVELMFDRDGLREIIGRGVELAPAMAALISPDDAEIARTLRPHGRVDMELSIGPDQSVVATGSLSEATLRPVDIPFPLEDCTLSFDYADGYLTVDDATVGLDGSELGVTFERTPERIRMLVDAPDIPFFAKYLTLIPGYVGVEWLDVHDGGTLDVDLEFVSEDDELSVTGRGGIYVTRVDVSLGDLYVEDIVGRFQITEDHLVFEKVSARAASGVVQVEGKQHLRTSELEFDLTVADVDLGELLGLIEQRSEADIEVRGWLEGAVHLTTVLGNPGANKGKGHMSIRAARLLSLPVVDAIARAIRPQRGQDGERQRLETTFEIEKRRVDLTSLRLTSETLPLYSRKGEIKFLGGDPELDLEIVLLKGPDIVEYVGAAIAKAEVTGTIGNPVVEVKFASFVTGPVSKIFAWIGGLFSSEEDDEDGSGDAGNGDAGATPGVADEGP